MSPGTLSNYPRTGCNPRKIQDLRAFSDRYLAFFTFGRGFLLTALR